MHGQKNIKSLNLVRLSESLFNGLIRYELSCVLRQSFLNVTTSILSYLYLSLNMTAAMCMETLGQTG